MNQWHVTNIHIEDDHNVEGIQEHLEIFPQSGGHQPFSCEINLLTRHVQENFQNHSTPINNHSSAEINLSDSTALQGAAPLLATQVDNLPEHSIPNPTAQRSLLLDTTSGSSSMRCRYCTLGEEEEPLIAPCQCKGSVEYIHQRCLNKWIIQKGEKKCELCRGSINTTYPTSAEINGARARREAEASRQRDRRRRVRAALQPRALQFSDSSLNDVPTNLGSWCFGRERLIFTLTFFIAFVFMTPTVISLVYFSFISDLHYHAYPEPWTVGLVIVLLGLYVIAMIFIILNCCKSYYSWRLRLSRRLERERPRLPRSVVPV